MLIFFRKSIDEYAVELKRVADGLLQIISKNLGDEFGNVYEMFKGGMQTLRFNYYPPCPSPEKVLGLSPHSDAVVLTLLLQMNEMHGLQIKRNGGWLPVKALPRAFIVNIGDIIEILCNGKYKSIEHRAVVNHEKERISVAGFHTLNIGDFVGPIPEIVKGDELLYKSLPFEEYAKQIFASKLEGKSILDRMKLDE
ncbi:protein SRG1-like [Dendrobium catenatum]|uniref:protein SRG1-like n=1 Tax=Dendrobium catenatum TaxID=906689 RepID=UPI0010A04AF8|nr:protein SRG1-like [Dendrobium catenatum]